MFAYTVACIFDDRAVALRWLDWQRGGHMADVVAAGALAAQAVLIDSSPGSDSVRCEARFFFASRDAFERYERDHAPRLRAEGLALFPLSLGLRYERTVGEVVASVGGFVNETR